MYKILRYFSIASLIGILLTALLLTLLYRQVAIKSITHLGEEVNVQLAQTALNSISPDLEKYLYAAADTEKEDFSFPRNAKLERAIQNIMRDTRVVKIKIRNRHGILVFSAGQVKDQHEKLNSDAYENRAFRSAMRGKVASKLIYRDHFNPFDQASDDDNLIQTYLPVRRTIMAPIQGVFEIYTDVNHLVAHAQYTQVVTASGAALILILLYLMLLIIVRRAEKLIAAQQHTIRARTQTLEILSAQLLTSQENDKKRIANDLHEDVAQTLSAIKFQVENAYRMAAHQSPQENAKTLDAIVTTIQSAIHNVSAMALDLRPPSLDDLGVIATIGWYCRKFQSLHPEIHLDLEIKLEENDVPQALKIILYRITQEMLDNLAKNALTNHIAIQLNKLDGISLTIEDSGQMYKPLEAISKKDKRIWRYAIEERAVLSGGSVFHELEAPAKNRIRFTWAR